MIIRCLFLPLMLGAVVGCQTVPYKPYARKVKIKPRQGGVVALKLNHRQEDRIYAEQIMSRTCGTNPFDVLEEGEVVIGTETQATKTHRQGQSGRQVGSLFGIPVSTSSSDPQTSTNSTTTQKKEWQINYKCKNVARSKKSRRSKIR